MSNLRRVTSGLNLRLSNDEINTLDGSEALEDYEVEFERSVSIDGLETAMAAFADRRLGADDDAPMAAAVRHELPMTRREAASLGPWWWLTARQFPRLVRSRWGREGETKRERMLGGLGRNALSRLWWGAELVREFDVDGKYLKLLFGNQDVFEAIIGRNLGKNPMALKVILDVLGKRPGKTARETIREFRVLLSTLMLEAMEEGEIAEEIERLAQRRVASA